jgi:hypothetical protein
MSAGRRPLGSRHGSPHPLRRFRRNRRPHCHGIGYYVEIEFSSAASLVVFLALFFANFVVSWIAVILVMDGSLRDAQGRQAQLDIERSGRMAMNEADARRRAV